MNFRVFLIIATQTDTDWISCAPALFPVRQQSRSITDKRGFSSQIITRAMMDVFGEERQWFTAAGDYEAGKSAVRAHHLSNVCMSASVAHTARHAVLSATHRCPSDNHSLTGLHVLHQRTSLCLDHPLSQLTLMFILNSCLDISAHVTLIPIHC